MHCRITSVVENILNVFVYRLKVVELSFLFYVRHLLFLFLFDHFTSVALKLQEKKLVNILTLDNQVQLETIKLTMCRLYKTTVNAHINHILNLVHL